MGDKGEAEGCPNESMLNFKLSGGRGRSYQCLGDWTGENGMKYLSLLDMELPQLGEKPRPRYRCAIYQAHKSTGITYLALSNDSTCVNQLDSHLSGEEVLVLTKKMPYKPGHYHKNILPSWAQGKWEGGLEAKGADMTYRSQERLATYHMRAIMRTNPGIFLVKVETECGEKGYACLALSSLSAILEMKIGQVHDGLHQVSCSHSAMEDPLSLTGWVTQVRERVSCPMQGEWWGVIPDAEGLCARSVTSCDRPDMMQYQVYNCDNQMEVYEDRLYQCYGQLKDNQLVYTLTKRMDLQKQECFVGIPSHDGKHKIMGAGEHCDRGLQPHLYGMNMEMVRDLTCNIKNVEDNQSVPKNVYNQSGTKLHIKLLQPRKTLKTINPPKPFEDVEDIKNVNDHVHVYDHPELSTSNSSLCKLSKFTSLFLLSLWLIL